MKQIIFSFYLLFASLLYAQIEQVDDRYRWLENESDQTTDWIENQQKQTDAYFTNDDSREKLSILMKKFFNFDALTLPSKNGENYFFLGRLAGEKQAALYTYNKTKMNEKVCVVDPIEFSDQGIVSITNYAVNGTGDYIAYGLSTSSSDWQEWKIRDLKTGNDLPESLNNILFNQVLWDFEGKGLYYFQFERGDVATAATCLQSLYYHKLGTSTADDKMVFQSQENDLIYDVSITDENLFLLSFTKGFGGTNGILCIDLKKDSFEVFQLLPFDRANYIFVGTAGGRLYFITNENAPNKKIISIDPSELDSSQWIEHVSEIEDCIEQVFLSEDKIIVSYLHNVCSKIWVYDQEGIFQNEIQLPGLGHISSLSGGQIDNDLEVFFTYTDFLHPSSIYICDLKQTKAQELFGSKVSWNENDYCVKQVFYMAKDQEPIPLFILHKNNLELNGENPTLLYGYGGFNISVTPTYSPRVLAWLELGGVYVVANIRGGGEYGEAWHEAGKLSKKQTVFDDFIAAAEWLCHNRYTNSSKLAIHGRSNGGLLTAACLVQRPELFKAAVIGVGVLDMLRFHLFTVGSYWISEYGSPDDPEDFKVLYEYSPYHQVESGTIYPSTLITTSFQDNRVVPLHSYKFAAAMQEGQAGKDPILLRIYENNGHGMGRSLDQIFNEELDLLYFLNKELSLQH